MTQVLTRDFDALPRGVYQVVYADPPWLYYGDPNKDQAAGKHYRCMSFDELAVLPVRQLLAKRAVVCMWTTGPKMAEACCLMSEWGCYYRNVMQVWIKTTKAGRVIKAQGARPSFVKQLDEFIILGSTNERGRTLPIMTEKMEQNGFAPRPNNVHSAKPALFRDRIVELFGENVRRVELFARTTHPGWDAWGNECPCDDARGARLDDLGHDLYGVHRANALET